MQSLYGFTCDYPAYAWWNPANARRSIDMRDMIAMSILLAGFTPYLSDQLDADAVYQVGEVSQFRFLQSEWPQVFEAATRVEAASTRTPERQASSRDARSSSRSLGRTSMTRRSRCRTRESVGAHLRADLPRRCRRRGLH